MVTEPLTCRSFPFRAPSGTWVAHRDIDAALDLLQRCFSSLDHEKANWFKYDSTLDALRSHPRYQKLSNASDENGGTLFRWNRSLNASP
jgi:hypothetical protein